MSDLGVAKGLPGRQAGGWARTVMTVSLAGVIGFLPACNRRIEIVSRTVTNGTLNGAAFAGSIEATIQVGRGGNTTCTFTQLPQGFNPGTIGTHA